MRDFERDRGVLRIMSRLQSVVARGVVTRTDDSKKVQRFQMELLDSEGEEDIEHFQPQGLSFTVEPGAEAVCVAVGGERNHTIAICAQNGKRPTGSAPGTGGLYGKSGKWFVFHDANGIVNIGADGESAKDFVALQQLVKDQFDEVRKRIDDLTTFATQLHSMLIQFGAHTHIVATAMGPATAAPVVPPLTPLTPITPPLGAAKEVKAEKTKAT